MRSIKNTYQIIILGPGGVGKTKGTHALIQILNSLGFQTSEVKPWSEDLVVTSNYVIHNFVLPAGYFPGINHPLYLVIYDMGGQFKYKEMWKQLATDTDAIIICVDMTRKSTLLQVPLMLPQGIMKDVPVRLIVNKADLYSNFSANAENIADAIYFILQTTVTEGKVDYKVRYRGEKPFVFNNKVHRYGDVIHVHRALDYDADGDIQIRVGDFEVLASIAFKELIPGLSEHNGNLFGREVMLQLFNILYKWINKTDVILTEDVIIAAHQEAPPFISWGSDPKGIIPKINKINMDALLSAINSMLIEDTDLITMINLLRSKGYNLDVTDRDTWEFTSAHLIQEDPDLTYKPINMAMMPPKFINEMIKYSIDKSSEAEDDYFI